MPAIITDSFRKMNAENLISSIQDEGNTFYLGLGKSDKWDSNETLYNYTAPIPSSSIISKQDVIDNLILLKKIAKTDDNVTRLVPKNKWYASRKYKVYNPYDESCFDYSGGHYPCYIYNDNDNSIYLCLSKPGHETQSTVKPTADVDGSPQYNLVEGEDKYVWIKIFDVSGLATNSFFNSSNFIPVNTPSEPVPTESGKIFGFHVVDGGTGYNTTTPYNAEITVDVEYADGSPSGGTLDIEAVVYSSSAGKIRTVYIDSKDIKAEGNENIIRANVRSITIPSRPSSATDPTLVALITPIGGFNSDPLDVLPSYYVGIGCDVEDEENGNIFADISYRQVSIIKNASADEDDSPSDDAVDCLKYAVVEESVVDGAGNGDIIEFANGAKAWVDYYSTAFDDENRIYFHQNSSSSVNRLTPGTGEATTPTGTYTVTDIKNPEYTPKTGEVIFIENRKPITRTENQLDIVRIIIQL